jgi:hypothetical protein
MKDAKKCTKCKQVKSLFDFSQKNPTGRKPGLQPRCKPCCIEDVNEWRLKKGKDGILDLYYKRLYNISLEDFNQRFIAQGGKCLLCTRELNLVGISGDRSVVDHCHKTGRVRGILCNECNRGLGYFKDNVMTLTNAIAYLTEEDQTSEGGQ